MSDKIDFKMSLEAGLIPFNPMRIKYVGGDVGLLNIQEKLNVELRRIKYIEHIVELGVSPKSPHWKRLTGEK